MCVVMVVRVRMCVCVYDFQKQKVPKCLMNAMHCCQNKAADLSLIDPINHPLNKMLNRS